MCICSCSMPWVIVVGVFAILIAIVLICLIVCLFKLKRQEENNMYKIVLMYAQDMIKRNR